MMRYSLKKISRLEIGLRLWLGLLAAMAGPAWAGVNPEAGQVSPSGEIQWAWDWTQKDPDNGRPRVESFDLLHARLGFSGEVGRYADFLLRAELLAGSTSPLATTLLDARLDLKPVSALTVSVGRFAPAWTLYAPADIHNLDTLRFPIMADPTLSAFNPGRQTGVQGDLRFGDNVDVYVGGFNGLDRANNFSDNDASKDLLVSAEMRLREQLRLLAGYYNGDLHIDGFTLAPGQSITLPSGQTVTNPTNQPLTVQGYNLHHESFDLGASGNLARDRIRVRAEYLHHRGTRAGATQVESLGYLLHLGLKPLSRVEALVRYEYYDPDTSVTKNELIWTTAGLNLDVADHARLSLNYIFKKETGTNLRQGGNKSTNDEFLAGITAWW